MCYRYLVACRLGTKSVLVPISLTETEFNSGGFHALVSQKARSQGYDVGADAVVIDEQQGPAELFNFYFRNANPIKTINVLCIHDVVSKGELPYISLHTFPNTFFGERAANEKFKIFCKELLPGVRNEILEDTLRMPGICFETDEGKVQLLYGENYSPSIVNDTYEQSTHNIVTFTLCSQRLLATAVMTFSESPEDRKIIKEKFKELVQTQFRTPKESEIDAVFDTNANYPYFEYKIKHHAFVVVKGDYLL